jgi:hypothetical protein
MQCIILYIHTWKDWRVNEWKTCLSSVEYNVSIGEVSQAFGVVPTHALNKTVWWGCTKPDHDIARDVLLVVKSISSIS